eukprot:scaffold33308_cov31-Attheya_sp.AAC.3
MRPQMDGLKNLFAEGLSIPKCVKLLSKENDAVFLKINPINKKACLTHHFYKFRGTRIQPEALYTSLVGFDYKAAVVMIEISLLFHLETIRVPKWDSMLKECKYIANLKALMAPPENAAADDSEDEGGGDATFETLIFQNFLVLPPFLVHTLINSESRDPCELMTH